MASISLSWSGQAQPFAVACIAVATFGQDIDRISADSHIEMAVAMPQPYTGRDVAKTEDKHVVQRMLAIKPMTDATANGDDSLACDNGGPNIPTLKPNATILMYLPDFCRQVIDAKPR